MKIILGILLLCVMFTPTFAHPGNTASDGCHYCRTNCDKWGVAWDERHCHNTYVEPEYTAPAYTPPEPVTYTPTPVVEEPQKEVTTIKPAVKAATTANTSSNSSSNDADNSWLGWLVGIGGVGAIAYAMKKKKD